MTRSLRITTSLLILFLAVSCSHKNQEKWDFVEPYDSSENEHTGIIKSYTTGNTVFLEIEIYKNNLEVIDQLNYVDSLNANFIVTDKSEPVEHLPEDLVKSLSIQIDKEYFKGIPIFNDVILDDDEMIMKIPGLGIFIDYSD